MTAIAFSACNKDPLPSKDPHVQFSVKIEDSSHPLDGAELRFSPFSFLSETKPTLEHFPDQGPILFDHISVSPRITILPITDQINPQYPLRLTLPLIENSDVNIKNIYVLALGDAGWQKFIPASVTKNTVTIEIREIQHDPFVAVIDK